MASEAHTEVPMPLAMPRGLGARQAPSLELPTPVITGGGNRPERQSDGRHPGRPRPPYRQRNLYYWDQAHRQA